MPEVDETVIAKDLARQLTDSGKSQLATKVVSALAAAAPSINESIAASSEKLIKVLEDRSSTKLEIAEAKSAVADAQSQAIMIALEVSKGNTQSLALPVTQNASLPEVPPGKSLIVTPTGTVPSRVEIVDNSTIVMRSQRENLSLAMSAISSDGEPAEITARGAVQAAPGQSLAVTGSGFMPNSKVAVWMFSSPRSFGFVITDANGSFAAEVPMPDNIVPGDHTAQVNGLRTNGETRSLNLGVEVALEEAPIPLDRTTSTAVRVLTSRVQFDAQSPMLTETTRRHLRRIAEQLQGGLDIAVTCVGYTQEGVINGRYVLAKLRANSVCEYIRKLGIRARFESIGMGRARVSTSFARHVAITIRYTSPISRS